MKTMKRTDRRKFLLAAGLGSAGVAAAVIAPGTKQPVGQAVQPEAKSQTAYQPSAHVLKYYKTTEV